jgi:hypothetical protein
VPITIKVNGTVNSLVHKMSNGMSVATIPDVCKTPTPGGPVPIPYPNIAQSITLASGTTTVKGDKMMAAHRKSKFALSNGDQAGTLGGVKSNVFMKEATWILYSFDVKVDGKNACRFTDKMFHNAENAANLSGEFQPGVAAAALGVSEADATAICEAFCQAQKEHLDPKNKKVKGSGSASRRFEELLKKKNIPGLRTEQSYWMPRPPAAPQLLTRGLFNTLARSLAGTRPFNLVKGLIGRAGGAAGRSVLPGAGVRLSRAMKLARLAGRVARPDVIMSRAGQTIVMDAKFKFFSGGKDKFTAKQLKNYTRIGNGTPPKEINGDDDCCQCSKM